MSHYKCPHCGYVHEIQDSEVEAAILRVITKYQLLPNGRLRPVSTREISQRIFMSHNNALLYLKRLEERGALRRVGMKKGWMLSEILETE